MHRAKEIAGLVLAILMAAGIGLGLLTRALKRAEDPAQLVFKWLLSAGVLFVLVRKVVPMVSAGGYGGAFGGIPATALCGLALAIIWRKSLALMIAKPFSDLYDGGDAEIEPRPAYSAALAQRFKGNYTIAVAKLREQLAKFPTDFEGQMLLAEIQAENMADLAGAEITIHRLCDQPGHSPRNVASALNSLADWHLKLAQDRDAAKLALEKIIALLPGSEMAALAAQRIGHPASHSELLSPHDRKKIAVPQGVENIGLLAAEDQPKAPEADPAQLAANYVRHLEAHPLDTEAREKLAVLYAEHYARLDLATDQLEQLIEHPNQPAKRVVHWLNLLADLQVRHLVDYETVRQTLQRIVQLFPESADAARAENRLAHLKIELKGQTKTPTVKLGVYEQDIGLKGGSARES